MPGPAQNPIHWQDKSVSNLDWSEIGCRLIDNGYCLFDCEDAERDRLLTLTRACGTLARHERADGDGVAEVVSKQDSANKAFRGMDANIFPPHTDGAYLDTYTYTEKGLSVLTPPRIILLQCVNPAAEGGESILIDGNEIFAEMEQTDPVLFQALQKPQFVIARHKNKVVNIPILGTSPDGGCRYMRFRHDILVPTREEASLARFFDRYINNTRFWIEFTLKRNQILMVDNFRMLHMRKAFKNPEGAQPRTLRRTWVKNDLWSNDINLPDEMRHSAFDDSQSYGWIDGESATLLTAESGVTCHRKRTQSRNESSVQNRPPMEFSTQWPNTVSASQSDAEDNF